MKKHDYFAGVLGAIFLSIPFWWIWNKLAPIYCYWLPTVYQKLPFWHCVGLFVLLTILRVLIYPPIMIP